MASSARITINLTALAANYTHLRALAATAEVAAVVKANAYGLGLEPIAARLMAAGCRSFFVGTLAEAIELRDLHSEPRVFVLEGLELDSLPYYSRHRLVPVLNTLTEVMAWAGQGRAPAALQIDTGMTRAGLGADEVETLRSDSSLMAALDLQLILSHLACADEPANVMNLEQLERFGRLCKIWPSVPWSLANSAGIFLGSQFHGNLVRPGIALYGGRPQTSGPNPMAEVARLEGRVVQIRTLRETVSVGYGATQRLQPPARVATVAAGYADGYPRSLSSRGYASSAEGRLPVVGRISMDLITLDASAHPELRVGDYVDLLGGGVPLENIAALAGTVNYELLTALSRRAARIYL